MTSFLHNIVVDVKTFFANLETSAGKFCAAFAKLFGKAPTALQTIENFTGEVAPIVEAAVTLVDPVAEAPVAAALSTVQVGLAAIQAAATAAVSGTSLVSSLQNFAKTVPAVLNGLDIKNATLKASVERVVNLVVGECAVLIPAAENWAKQLTPSATAA